MTETGSENITDKTNIKPTSLLSDKKLNIKTIFDPFEFNLLNSSLSSSSLFGHNKEAKHEMTTYNHSSSYNRTYERKVIEEGTGGNVTPTVRIHSSTSSSPLHTIRTTLGGAFPSSSSFITPHNYHFGTSTLGKFQSSDDNLTATLDVSAFAPEELKVSVIGNYIVIEGAHGEKTDDLGLIERRFVRKFLLPRNALPESVTSNLSGEGQLTVIAQSPKPKEASPSRNIPIKIVQSSPQPTSTEEQQRNLN